MGGIFLGLVFEDGSLCPGPTGLRKKIAGNIRQVVPRRACLSGT
jgi:hypothetical protein